MQYIIDTNILIDSKNRLFPMETYPKFWDWLKECATDEVFFIPEEAYKELQAGNDKLADWVKSNKNLFFIPTIEAYGAITEVLQGYSDIAGIPSEECLEALKADPYLIAHAIIRGCTVVTSENYFNRNSTAISKIKIPRICEQLGVRCIGLSTFIWEIEKKHFTS